MISHRLKSFYQPGGALPLDSPAYVRRLADDELFTFLLRGDYCSILTSRQMGKSSLIARTSARLRAENVATCVIDLSGMSDARIEPDKWYFALALKIGKTLKQGAREIAELWSSSEWPTPDQRWTACIEQLLLQAECDDESFQLVVFIDEIDATRDMAFKDGFFATIRSCYNRRSADAVFRRLAFCLVGSARPTDLIADPHLTPFNIGRRIEITDFSEQEAQALIPGMEREEAEGKALLQRVLYWTGGHPYLTHRLCMQIAESESVRKPEDVDGLAASLFFSTGSREQDDNLAFVSHRVLTSCSTDREVARILSTYDDLLRGKSVRDQKSDSMIGVLHLAGIVRSDDGFLSLRNRIYARVFDRAWVRENMPGAQLRMVRAAYWRAALRWSGLAALMAVLAVYAMVQRRTAIRNEATAARLAHVEHVILMQSMQALWEHADLAQMEANLRNTPLSERNFEWRYWLRQMHQNLRTLSDPESGGERIAAAAFSPDGAWVATAGKFPFIDIWDPKSGTLLRRLPAPSCPYTLSLDVSPDGTRLVSGGVGEVAQLWDTISWQSVATLDMGTKKGEIPCVRFSPDGRLIGASMHDGKGVGIFDGRFGKSLYRFPTDTTFALAFDPIEPLVAVATGSNRVELWRLDSRQRAPISVLSANDSWRPQPMSFSVDSLAFSKDGKRLAGGSKDNTIRVWDVHGRRVERTLRGSENGVSSVAFKRDGEEIVGVGLDRAIRTWDMRSGEQVGMIPAHARWINSVVVCRNGLMATASDDGTCKIWSLEGDLYPKQTPAVLTSIGKGMVVDGKYMLLTADINGRLGWLDPQSKVWTPFADSPRVKGVIAFAYPPDKHLFETIESSGRILRWNAEDMTRPPAQSHLPAELVSGLVSGALSPDGDQALLTLKMGRVAWIDLRAGSYRFVSSVESSQFSEVVWSPGVRPMWSVGSVGHRLLYISDPNFAHPPIRVPINSCGGLYVSNDGLRVLVTCRTVDHDPDPTLIDLPTLNMRRLIGHAAACQFADFSPDGARIVTVGADNTLRLWDTVEGVNLQTWRIPFDPLVAFAPDGNSIIVLLYTLRLLSAATPDEVADWTKGWRTP